MNYLHEILLKHKESNRIAIIDEYSKYSYSELYKEAIKAKNKFTKMGIKKGNIVVIISESNFYSISLLIACSLKNITFVIISPNEPLERKNKIIKNVDPSLVLINQKELGDTDDSFGIGNFKIEQKNIYNIPYKTTNYPAYIVFTSGSTGEPKGIVMSHSSVVSFFSGLLDEYSLNMNSRYVSFSPLQFDFALLDIGFVLGSGATLIFPKKSLLLKPKILMEYLVDNKPTHISSVPTIWKMLLSVKDVKLGNLKSLKAILFAGEHFPINNMRKISEEIKGVNFFNIYGQSESIACTFGYLESEDIFSSDVISVGKVHKHMCLLLLDKEHNVITNCNEYGELYIGGSTLFSGYWKNEELNAEKLIQNPTHNRYQDIFFKTGDICCFDKNNKYYFKGRIDNQYKINGNRVEIEEIENAFMLHHEINNCCVIIDKEMMINVIIETKNNFIIKEDDLRTYVKNKIPSYMLPKNYFFVKKIILSINGKNDKKKNAINVGIII